MKNFILVFVIISALAFGSVFAQSETSAKKGKKATTTQKTDAKSVKKSSKPIKGTVINLLDFATGGTGKVTKSAAIELAKKGEFLALQAGSGKSAKIYIIANADGTSASKKIAELADAPIGIIGKVISRNGINIIIAEIIENMR